VFKLLGWLAGPERIPELLDRIRAASVAAGRPADAVRAVYSVPVRPDPRARTTAGVVAGSAADVIEQLHGFTELGFTGFDLMPSRDQLRAVAEDVVPALRGLRVPSPRPQPGRPPDGAPAASHPGPRPRPGRLQGPARAGIGAWPAPCPDGCCREPVPSAAGGGQCLATGVGATTVSRVPAAVL